MRALVVRFSAIGDCVMAVPVPVAIRRRYPEAFIVWAVEPRCAPVIETETLINDLALFPRDAWEARRYSPQTWFDQVKRYLGMRRYRFDIGLDLQGHSKTALCLRLANPKARIAVAAKDALARRLNPVLGVSLDEAHTVERHMMALGRLGDYDLEPQWVMPTLRDERARVAALVGGRRPLATISISAGQAAKAYPAELWAEVSRLLVKTGWRVVFLGGPGDPPSPDSAALDLVGKLDLAETMAAVAISDVHLAADTGTGHMAAAYGVPVVSVFGYTKASAFRPYTSRGVVLEGKLKPGDVAPEQIVVAARSFGPSSAGADER